MATLKMSGQYSSSVQDTTVLVLFTILSSGINFLSTYVLARWMGPDLYGRWQVLITLIWYVTIVDFGINLGITRDVPYFLGRTDAESYRKTAGTVLLWNLTLALFEVGGFAVAGGLASVGSYLHRSLPWVGVFSLAYCFSNYSHMMLYSHRGIRLWSFCTFLRNFLRLIFSVFLFRYGVEVLLGAWTFCELVIPVLIRWLNPVIRFYFAFDWKICKRLVALGFASFLLTIVQWQSRIGDRAIVAMFLGAKSMGYYGLASTFSSSLVMLSIQVSQAMHARIMRKYGETGDVMSLKEHILEPCRAVSLVFPTLIGFAFLGVPLFLRFFLPAYAPAVPVILVLSVFSIFLALPQTQGSFLFALDKQWLNLWIWCVVLGVNLGLNFVFLSWGWGTTGVAWGTGLAWGVSFFVHMGVTLPYHLKSRESAKFILELFLPFLYTLVLLASVKYALSFFAADAKYMEFLGILCFALAELPVFRLANRRYRLWASVEGYFDLWKHRIAHFYFETLKTSTSGY